MGRINKYSNGDRVNQHRKSQGKFLEKQDIESYLFSKKLNNGNNIQGENTPNIDDLPNIPAMLDYAPSQGSIKHIDGGTAHNPTAQAFLTFLTALSAASAAPAIFPNITASSNKAILTDNQNSLLARVTSPTGKMPILFDTTPATTSTSQNHAPSLIREKDGLIRHNADGNIILGNDGQKLTFSHHLDIDILEQQLTNSNITELCLWAVKIDPQKVQEIGNFLKGSNVKVLSILHGSIRNMGAIDFGTMLTDTKVTTLNLAYNEIGNKVAKGLIKSLEGTNVKALDLSNNNMSDDKVKNIIPELKKNTQIIELGLKDKGIERNTLKEVLKVLKQNRQVNKESTFTIKSSPTEGESSTEEEHTSKKREKRDIHTTDETSQQETAVLTTDVSSTTTKRVTTSSTEGLTTTEQEPTVPTTLKSSTTTTKSTASSAGNPTTDSAIVWSNPQKTTTLKEELTTPKKNLTEKSEPIAADVVVDSITEKHTPKESNPNDPASSTMSTKEILALISFVLTAVSIGGGVAICVIKKLFDGASSVGHDTLLLAELMLPKLDNHLDNNHEDTSLTGITVNDDMD